MIYLGDMLDKNDLKEIQKLFVPITKEVKVIKKDLAETRNDVKTLIAYFDRDYVELRKRIEAIEDHLGFQTH